MFCTHIPKKYPMTLLRADNFTLLHLSDLYVGEIELGYIHVIVYISQFVHYCAFVNNKIDSLPTLEQKREKFIVPTDFFNRELEFIKNDDSEKYLM